MAKLSLSSRRIQINKANSTIVVAVAIAAAVTAFSMVTIKALLAQSSYRSRVISSQEKALSISDKNVKAVDQLIASYQVFNGQTENIIGGGSAYKSDNGGENSKIILDALPSQYDFPALVSSLEKILKDRNFKVDSISGTDAAIEANSQGDSAVEMPFDFRVKGSYAATQDLVKVFERTVRPIVFTSMILNADESSLTMTVSAKTYYQPGKNLRVVSQDIK